MKFKIFTVVTILILDILLLPSVARLPEYIIRYLQEGPTMWLRDFHIIEAIKYLFQDEKARNIYFVFQIVLALILFLMFFKVMPFKKNRIREGVGGPDAAGQGQYGTSRWQTDKETSKSATIWKFREESTEEKVVPGGIILGMLPNKKGAWIESNDLHTLIIGATRSGKTRRLVFPTIWQLGHAGESMVVADPKGELYQRSSLFLQRKGYRVKILDFREPGWGNRWNPIKPVVDAVKSNNYAKASQQAWSIAHMFVHQKGGSKSDPIWDNGAESVLAALILAVAIEAPDDSQKHMTSVYKLLAELGETIKTEFGDYVPLNEFMKSLPLEHPARDAFATARLAPERTRGSFYATCSALLRLFSDPSISYLTAEQDHNLEDVGKEKTAVFLIIPDEDKTRHPLAALYVDQTYQALVDLANKSNGRIPVRVHMLLDEFGNMPPIKDFDSKLTVSGGRGVRWHLIVQDFQQIKAAYKDAVNTIKGNCHTWIYLLTKDTETAKEISLKCGRYTIETSSSSATVRSYDTTKGISSGLTGRDLLTPDEVERFPGDQSLVLRSRQFPARLPLPDLSQWPADQDLVLIGGDPQRSIKKVPVFIPGNELSTPKESTERSFIEELEV